MAAEVGGMTSQAKWAHAQSLNKEIRIELKRKDSPPSYEHIDLLVAELRKHSESVIFKDFEYATEQGVENHVWDITILLKNRFKKLLDRFHDKDAKVEKRKLEKRYVDFLKTTQFYYKGYIQRLASHFGGMKDLRRIAHRLTLETLSADPPNKASAKVERLVEISCHTTLLHLGDLSRYRNELRTKKSNSTWDSALGYYGLARDLFPDSGSSHNQMAVIALADQNHLDALYHLYRAIAVKEPHALARGNLEIEFKKITSIWEKKEKQTVPHASSECEAAMVLWFVRLHAKFYKGAEFAGHDELENEVLSRLGLLLREQSFEITLERIVIINIAAEYLAGERVREQGQNATPESIQSFFFFLRLNLRMLYVLLQILHAELNHSVDGEDLPNGSLPVKPKEILTNITRRILPALRQYSFWLVSQALIITASAVDGPISSYMKQMWKMYANVMTAIVHTFPCDDLPSVEYLLEEDETTVGFKPLRDATNASTSNNIYTNKDGALKPRITDPGVERNHPKIEMLARIRDILLSALSLHLMADCPVKLKSGVSGDFVFLEEGLQGTSEQLQTSESEQEQYPRTEPARQAIPSWDESTNSVVRPAPGTTLFDTTNHRHGQSSTNWEPTSESQQSIDTDMHRMVDDLLETSSERYSGVNETSYGMHSATANDVFGSTYGNYQTRGHSSQSAATPASAIHPGIWSSAFTPQRNELPPISPERPSTGRQMSPFEYDYKLREQKLLAAASLDAFAASKSNWGKNVPSPYPIAYAADRLPRRSSQQPFSSSNFSDDSSIYANRTDVRLNNTVIGRGPVSTSINHDTTNYPGASDFDRMAMLRSSIWNGSQPAQGGYIPTPPGGQGG